jgi:DNA-binding response OmpR family regulator
MRILIVEDNPLVGTGLYSALTGSGFEAVWVKDGETALECLAAQAFHALVLDLGLPGVSGMDVLRSLRQSGNQVPALILTARDSTQEKVLAFKQGADDFVTKTTDIEELVARLHALIRRSGRDGQYMLADIVLDIEARTVTHKSNVLNLSRREFDILKILIENAGQVVTRKQIEKLLYGDGRHAESNSIDVHIHNLRQKLVGLNLLSVRGVGYTISAAV